MRIAVRSLIVCAALLCARQAGAAQETAAVPDTSAAQETIDLAKFLPPAGAIEGWRTDGDPLVYTPDNLWEYIDGAAENFLSFDFRRVLAQEYLSSGDRGLKAEIYEHGSPLMAYGIYSQMRSPGLARHAIGDEAFSDEYSLHVWKDRYYVRVAVFEPGEDSDAALKLFAEAIAAAIPGGGAGLPLETAAFPREGLGRNDLRYVTEGVLGREDFPPAFIGTYLIESQEGRLYLATLDDSAAARDTFEWYTDGMESFIATAEGPRGDYILGVGKDPHQGDVVVFTYGKYLGVLAGVAKPGDQAIVFVKSVVENLHAIEAARKRHRG
jgi:hypothetical protein